MPKRDPNTDGRTTSNGCMPKQAAIQRERKRQRQRKKITKTEAKLKQVERELTKTEKKLVVKQQMLELASTAPSPAQMRKLIWATFEELEFNPVTALIDAFNEIKDPKEKAQVAEKLAKMVIANPKSVDIEAEIKGGLTISLADFSKVTQKQLRQQTPNPIDQAIDVTPDEDTLDPEYAEFVSEEEQHAAKLQG